MPNNDDYGFWESDRDWSPEGSSPRPRRAPRTVTPTRAHQPGARPAQPNLLLRRVGALGAAGLLALTVALVVRGTGNTDQISTAAAAAGDIPIEPVAVVPLAGGVITAPVAAAPATAAATPATATPATATPAPAESTPATAAPVETTLGTTAATARTASPAAEAASTQTRPAALATPVVETKRTCAIDYKVRAGDYWISIAQRASVKLADLLTANGAKVTTALYPGRTICLPANATTPTTAKPTPTTAKPTVTTTKPKPTVNTAAPTTAAPSTTAAPPRTNYSRAEVEQIIRNVWPDDLEDEALRIATRESNLIPTARNSCCYGLFQIYFTANKASLTSWGITSPAALYDPQVNAYAAYAMYLRAGGWGPWRL